MKLQRVRPYIYPVLLLTLWSVWGAYMTLSHSWGLFGDHWPASVTMTGGSFVAGATAEGGAAVAFPVFTKVLHIEPQVARTFGLMIQSIGMTMASVVIVSRGIPILPRVILWVSMGGLFGQIIGTFFIVMPDPYPRILFTFTAAVFGVAMFISRWVMDFEPRTTVRGWDKWQKARFIALGMVGGWFAAHTGSGIDMLTFIVLTLAFGINEKISTPTTVIIMAMNSIWGFFLHGAVAQDIGIAFHYWLVAVPIVAVGAPLGAMAAYYLPRDGIIIFLLSLITLEVFTTVWLVQMSPANILFTVIAMIICACWFVLLLNYRHKYIAPQMCTVEMQALGIPVE